MQYALSSFLSGGDVEQRSYSVLTLLDGPPRGLMVMCG